MSSPAPDPAVAIYRLDVILGSAAAVLVALLGCCGVLVKKARRARCKLWCMSLLWGSVPPSPMSNHGHDQTAAHPPDPFAIQGNRMIAV